MDFSSKIDIISKRQMLAALVFCVMIVSQSSFHLGAYAMNQEKDLTTEQLNDAIIPAFPRKLLSSMNPFSGLGGLNNIFSSDLFSDLLNTKIPEVDIQVKEDEGICLMKVNVEALPKDSRLIVTAHRSGLVEVTQEGTQLYEAPSSNLRGKAEGKLENPEPSYFSAKKIVSKTYHLPKECDASGNGAKATLSQDGKFLLCKFKIIPVDKSDSNNTPVLPLVDESEDQDELDYPFVTTASETKMSPVLTDEALAENAETSKTVEENENVAVPFVRYEEF